MKLALIALIAGCGGAQRPDDSAQRIAALEAKVAALQQQLDQMRTSLAQAQQPPPPLKPEQRDENEEMEIAAKDFHAHCDSTIDVAIDWKSFEGVDVGKHRIYTFCDRPLERLEAICTKSESEKKKVQAKIKSFTCSFDATEVQRITLADGKLVWHFNWQAANPNDYLKDFFTKAL